LEYKGLCPIAPITSYISRDKVPGASYAYAIPWKSGTRPIREVTPFSSLFYLENANKLPSRLKLKYTYPRG